MSYRKKIENKSSFTLLSWLPFPISLNILLNMLFSNFLTPQTLSMSYKVVFQYVTAPLTLQNFDLKIHENSLLVNVFDENYFKYYFE